MTGLDFLNVARELALRNSEPHARTAISRAYFGAFHVARELVETWGFRVARSDSAHAMIARWLLFSGESEAVMAARRLDYLRTERNRADYDFHSAASGMHEFAQQCVESAETAVAALLRCDVEPVRSTVIDGIRDYQSQTRPFSG